MRERGANGEDRILAWLVAVLVLTGLIVVYDASFPKSGGWQMVKQAMWAFVGLLAYLVGKQISSRALHWLAPALAGLALLLMLAVRLPGIGEERGGAFRWLLLGQVGPVEITLQPAEFGKLAFILLMARCLCASSLIGVCASVRENRWPVMAVLATFLFAGIVAIVQEDLGTAMIFLGIGVGMLFVAGLSWRRVLVIIALVAITGCVFIAHKDYRRQRVSAFLNPFAQIETTGYQLAHSLMGIGTGGVWGAGLGMGRAKEFLPAADTDFVFTTVAEETGIWGSGALIALLGLVMWRLFLIARRTQAMYQMLLVSGIGIMIALQSLLNLYVVTGMVPTTGVPLPLISYGGSSLIALLFSLGIVQRVAQNPMSERVAGEAHARASGRRGNRGTSVSRREYRRGVA
ncbi:MAG: FtsW/RodA/SpoVE family cell cycle protein [Armatimonadota bacterium]